MTSGTGRCGRGASRPVAAAIASRGTEAAVTSVAGTVLRNLPPEYCGDDSTRARREPEAQQRRGVLVAHRADVHRHRAEGQEGARARGEQPGSP